jgi:hypothetical protein
MILHPSDSEVIYTTQVGPPFHAHKFRYSTIEKKSIVQLSIITQKKKKKLTTSNIYIQLGAKNHKSTPN